MDSSNHCAVEVHFTLRQKFCKTRLAQSVICGHLVWLCTYAYLENSRFQANQPKKSSKMFSIKILTFSTIQSCETPQMKQKISSSDCQSVIHFLGLHQKMLSITHGANFSTQVVECTEILSKTSFEVKVQKAYLEKSKRS